MKYSNNGPTIDEIRKKLEKIYNKKPSRKIGLITEYEKLHKIWVLNNFGSFVKYFEDSYDFFLDVVYSLNYIPKTGWAWKKNLQYIYFGTATRPLYKAFDTALEGFYDESSTVIRTAYELLVKIIFCSCYPNDIWATYATKVPKGQRKFNLSNFLKDDLKVDWEFLYGVTSGAAHGLMYLTRVISEMQKSMKHDPIGLWLKLDKNLMAIPVNQLTFLIWGFIRLLFEIFPEVHPDKKVNREFREKSKNFDDALGSIVKTMPNKFQQVGKDFEKIITIVRTAEKNGSWRKLVK